MTLWKDREHAHTFEIVEILLRREKHLDVTSVGSNPTVSTIYLIYRKMEIKKLSIVGNSMNIIPERTYTQEEFISKVDGKICDVVTNHPLQTEEEKIADQNMKRYIKENFDNYDEGRMENS